MARIVRFHTTGGPEVLQIDEMELRPPGHGELRIAVSAIGLNRGEAAFRSGDYMEKPNLPSNLGYEAVGRVLAIGEGVDKFAVGDSVSTIPGFSLNAYGVYGTEAIVPASHLIHAIPNIDPIKSAAIWMSSLTALGALWIIGRAKRGDFILIPAASSSIGLAAIQIANIIGAIPIATTRSADKAEVLRQHGAAHVVVTGEQDLVAAVMEITDGKGAQLAFDPVGGPFAETIARAMAWEGMVIIYGGLSGQETPFPRRVAMRNGLTFAGYGIYQIHRDPERFARAVAFIREHLQSGALDPPIDKVFALDDVVEAHRYLESNQQIGKIVIRV